MCQKLFENLVFYGIYARTPWTEAFLYIYTNTRLNLNPLHLNSTRIMYTIIFYAFMRSDVPLLWLALGDGCISDLLFHTETFTKWKFCGNSLFRAEQGHTHAAILEVNEEWQANNNTLHETITLTATATATINPPIKRALFTKILVNFEHWLNVTTKLTTSFPLNLNILKLLSMIHYYH